MTFVKINRALVNCFEQKKMRYMSVNLNKYNRMSESCNLLFFDWLLIWNILLTLVIII